MNANNSEKLFDWYLIFKELFQKKLEDKSRSQTPRKTVRKRRFNTHRRIARGPL